MNPSTQAHDGEVGRLKVLDGWRAISILLVLAAHLLPLGPKPLQLNETAGPMGMALFFTLSGFLITRFLIGHSNIVDFLIRRFFRIVPLAWLGLLIALPLSNADSITVLANFFFFANLPPQHLPHAISHYWSLCVEVQFYVAIAIVVRIFGARGLYAVPVACLAVTLHRISSGALVDIVTWRRIDEILAGCMLAMAYEGKFVAGALVLFVLLNPYLMLILLLISSHPASGPMNYLRPYVASMLVGATLFSSPVRLGRVLRSRPMAYIADISFALYVIHHLLLYTWLGQDESKLWRYVKRIPLFVLTFALAHLSTFHFERPCIALGKRISAARTRVFVRRPVD